MKKQVLLILFFFISVLSSAQENGVFSVSEGDRKIIVVLDSKLPYLEVNKPVKVITYFENINLRYSISIAMGLKKIGDRCEGNCATWELTPYDKGIVNGHYKIRFMYRLTEEGERKTLDLLIPVK